MEIRQKRAQRQRRGGIVARQARKRFLAELQPDGLFSSFELKAVLPALDRAGELVAQIRNKRAVVISERAQHRLGGGETRKLVV